MTQLFPDLPEGLLQTLGELVPEFTLVGSFARDYWVHTVAGLPRGARTLDVDIAILVPSIDVYRKKLERLDGPNATGIRFLVNGFGVDVIPYGSKVAPSGIVETADGITLDVTGMAEAAAGAEQVQAGGTTRIQVPTLSSMIGLKVIAWNYRGAATQKDARDLGPLLRATYHGPNSELVWEVSEAGERWDYDDVLVGPYLAGRELRASWRPESLERLTKILDDSGIATLATHISRLERTPSGQLVEQITALRAGITGR